MTKKRKPAKAKPVHQAQPERPKDTRRIALNILTGLYEAPAGTLADRLSASVVHLEPRDKGFVRALTLETLRRLGQIDEILLKCLTKGKVSSEKLAWVLRLGICQLLFLDVPPHAAVNSTVSLLRGPRDKHLTGLTNAILRRVAQDGAKWRDAQDELRLNTEDWLWDQWTDAYGKAAARAIAATHLKPAPLDISVKSHPEQWAKKLGATQLPTGTLRLENSGDVAKLPGYQEGAWWVQDFAASLPVKLLGDLSGKSALDLCAAPGGKTLQLAAKGADVTAIDISKNRMTKLAENLSRCDLTANQIISDATEWQVPEPVDVVLLDAPCSATGTLRRHPDLPLIKQDGDEAPLLAIQKRLLAAAWAMLKPGGTLIYCTCSLDPREGEQQIIDFLETTEAARRIPVSADELDAYDEVVTKQGDIRCLPSYLADQGGMDGFFIARLKKEVA